MQINTEHKNSTKLSSLNYGNWDFVIGTEAQEFFSLGNCLIPKARG